MKDESWPLIPTKGVCCLGILLPFHWGVLGIEYQVLSTEYPVLSTAFRVSRTEGRLQFYLSPRWSYCPTAEAALE